MTAFADALEVLFADSNIGHDAVYTQAGGTPVLIRAVARRADEITSFGDARLWSETTRVDLRVAEVPEPPNFDTSERDLSGFRVSAFDISMGWLGMMGRFPEIL